MELRDCNVKGDISKLPDSLVKSDIYFKANELYRKLSNEKTNEEI